MSHIIREPRSSADIEAVFAELRAIYVPAEADPDTAIICPNLNPLPHPTLQALKRHVAAGNRIVTVHSDRGRGRLVNVLLVADGTIRACWGPNNPASMSSAQLDPDGTAAYFESLGEVWTLDTGVDGWVASSYFAQYASQRGGPFDVTALDHPGLRGQPLTDFDDRRWTLTIDRPSPAEAWRWLYEVAPR